MGARRWVSRYNGPGNGYDAATAIAISPDGSTVYVPGRTYRPGAAGGYGTVAYNAATGAQRWVSQHHCSSIDKSSAVIVSPDGKASGQGYETVAYDAATGQQQWARRYGTPATASTTSLRR